MVQNFVLNFCKLLQSCGEAHASSHLFVIEQEERQFILFLILFDIRINLASILNFSVESNLRPCFLKPIEQFLDHFTFILGLLDSVRERHVSRMVSGGHVTIPVHHVVDEFNDWVELAKHDHFFIVFEAYLQQREGNVIKRVCLEGGSHVLKSLFLSESVQVEIRKCNVVHFKLLDSHLKLHALSILSLYDFLLERLRYFSDLFSLLTHHNLIDIPEEVLRHVEVVRLSIFVPVKHLLHSVQNRVEPSRLAIVTCARQLLEKDLEIVLDVTLKEFFGSLV